MDYTDLTAGSIFMLERAPYIVVSSEFHRMQMRKAVMRTTIRNLITGQLVQKTFTASERFDPAPVEKIRAQYLYNDGESYYFMDQNSLEQCHATQETLGDKVKFLTDNAEVDLLLFNHNPIQLILPVKIELKVVEAPDAIKGDSVTRTFKIVLCENGVKVNCPIFIREGDVIRVDTESGEYIERVR